MSLKIGPQIKLNQIAKATTRPTDPPNVSVLCRYLTAWHKPHALQGGGGAPPPPNANPGAVALPLPKDFSCISRALSPRHGGHPPFFQPRATPPKEGELVIRFLFFYLFFAHGTYLWCNREAGTGNPPPPQKRASRGTPPIEV